jgi:transcriptional regulator with XRE-family HTH domain
MNEIAKNLKALRSSKKMSLRALGEAIGVSHNTLATYERNEVMPTINNAMKICEYFQMPAEYLLYGKKVVTDFNDRELLKLFREIDDSSDPDRLMAKKFLKKLIKNIRERKKLDNEIEN